MKQKDYFTSHALQFNILSSTYIQFVCSTTVIFVSVKLSITAKSKFQHGKALVISVSWTVNNRILCLIILVTNENIKRHQSYNKLYGMLLGVFFHLDTETQAGNFHEWLLRQFCAFYKVWIPPLLDLTSVFPLTSVMVVTLTVSLACIATLCSALFRKLVWFLFILLKEYCKLFQIYVSAPEKSKKFLAETYFSNHPKLTYIHPYLNRMTV